MKSVAPCQAIGAHGAIGNIIAPVRVQKKCLPNVCPATDPPRIQFSNRLFDNRQRISAMELPNVQVNCKTGLVCLTLE